ncbi:MAG TPA: DUF6600 domain-containing protein [Bryobacteraceae bacterium]|nr:DUF6600 domain-containing protein [Bryobacteraceae bacterium]
MRRYSHVRFWALAGAAVLTAGIWTPARAQDPDDLKRGVGRISLINGSVSVQRGDSGDWVSAAINAPLLSGDQISTGPDSRAEIQFDRADILRIGGNAQVKMADLENQRYQIQVGQGMVTFRVLRQPDADVEVDTPSVSARPSREGSFRISVNANGETEVTARGGSIEVYTPRGSQWVNSGQTLLARGSASDPEFQIVAAGAYDNWDRWNDSRDAELTHSASYQYVGPGVYGVEDLDPYGSWVSDPTYGNVWYPRVAAGWAPYQSGRWVWEDWYGWTWVSYDPWGWAPYHYGRWFHAARGWCWYPGLIGVRHYWSPALVAFFGFGGGGVGVGFGFGNVGWVPLAPYEVFHPWWGRRFYGTAGYFNRNVNITNINITNVYRNARFRNGVTAVRANDFRDGRFHNFVHPTGTELQRVGYAQGRAFVNPERANLRFSDRAVTHTPRSIGNERFFTHRQPNPPQRVAFGNQERGNQERALQRGNSLRADPGRGASGPAEQRQSFRGSANVARQPQQFGNSRPAGQPATAVERNGNSNWRQFGGSRGQNVTANHDAPAARESRPSAPSAQRNDSNGWRRFGEPGGNQQANPRSMERQQFNRGWNGFGSPGPSAAPRQQRQNVAPQQEFHGNRSVEQHYNQPSRPQSLHIAPPVVRERSGGFGGASRVESRPSGGGFGGGARVESRPSGGGGGGHVSRGGGGGRASRGGGGRGGHGR